MKELKIAATQITPAVDFDALSGVLNITGESRPESVRDFYEPVINWLNEYFDVLLAKRENGEDVPDIKINFKLDYFNSSSAKYFLDLLKILVNKYMTNDFEVKIIWYFEEGDEDMQEAGEELSHMVKFPFSFVTTKAN